MLIEKIRGITHTEAIQFRMEECCSCNIPFFIPTYKYNELRSSHKTFHCPNGHQLHYSGKSEQQKKIEALEQQNKEYEDRFLAEITKRQKAEKDLKRLTKNGVCPCCTRSFTNVKRHIAHMHPEYNSTTTKTK